ncbi:hypothetical protein [Nonomuraea sp. C10]|uniref:hypothetical protein n=1 Tax=Nonomuraea sp. C10 TaxID=2600577 RepID=UPI0011CD904D|nr:hypothetical protein [Nonomuraea sp. C10]TXK33986.1 hypothetical protein FR742_31720 [Nonomuraea sp. C10]
MSPEGASGAKQDIRSDIYSLGLVLGFAATGRSPAGSESVPKVLYRIMQGHLDFDGSEPPLLDVVVRATRRAPDERFQHPDELRAAVPGQEVTRNHQGARPPLGGHGVPDRGRLLP